MRELTAERDDLQKRRDNLFEANNEEVERKRTEMREKLHWMSVAAIALKELDEARAQNENCARVLDHTVAQLNEARATLSLAVGALQEGKKVEWATAYKMGPRGKHHPYPWVELAGSVLSQPAIAAEIARMKARGEREKRLVDALGELIDSVKPFAVVCNARELKNSEYVPDCRFFMREYRRMFDARVAAIATLEATDGKEQELPCVVAGCPNMRPNGTALCETHQDR
jgi:hypothetical protein